MRGKLSIKLILFNSDMCNEHNVIKIVLGIFLAWISVYLLVLNMSDSDFSQCTIFSMWQR